MIQIAPQMRILVAVEPADFRKGIDGLARLCTEALKRDPFCGSVFVFRKGWRPEYSAGRSFDASDSTVSVRQIEDRSPGHDKTDARG